MKENPVMLYMKGVPEAPQCGFSSLAVRVLQQYSKLFRCTFVYLKSSLCLML